MSRNSGTSHNNEIDEPEITKTIAVNATGEARSRRIYERLDNRGLFEEYMESPTIAIQDGGEVTQNHRRQSAISEPRPGSSTSQTSRKSRGSVVEHLKQSDGFPWDPKPAHNVTFSGDLDVTLAPTYDAQSRRASVLSRDKEERKRARFLWWKRIVTKLKDNKIG